MMYLNKMGFALLLGAAVVLSLVFFNGGKVRGATPFPITVEQCDIVNQRASVQKELTDANLRVQVLDDVQSAKLIAVLTDKYGKPPMDINGIDVVRNETAALLVFYFNNCVVNMSQALPIALVDSFLNDAGLPNGPVI